LKFTYLYILQGFGNPTARILIVFTAW